MIYGARGTLMAAHGTTRSSGVMVSSAPVELPTGADSLWALCHRTIATDRPDVHYYIDRVLGEGGMAVAFFALRLAPDGETPAVLKILRPGFVRDGSDYASLLVRKEAVALGRLNEQVPQTPFVLRMIESGSLPVHQGGKGFELPWLGLEYVHGGLEGTTLSERVRHSVETTGYAFDAERAAHAIACLAEGLDAVHEVGVIHRDIKPSNVLCCGFGENEIFKLADFGLARPRGMANTFVGTWVGTPGYAAPEQIMLDDERVGQATDVFALATVVYGLLTGGYYFDASGAIEALAVAQRSERKSITLSPQLWPELRANSRACARIDAALARATSMDPGDRPQSGAALAAMLLPELRDGPPRPHVSARRMQSLSKSLPPSEVVDWVWRVRHQPGDERAVRSVAWDGDGRCLAATSAGLAFWNGSNWVEAPDDELPQADAIHFVHRVGPGSWLVGGEAGIFARYSAKGVAGVVQSVDPGLSFTHASGDPDDLAVVAAARGQQAPVLYALSARRWLKPAALAKARTITQIARIEDERWLVTGRSSAGDGFVALYAPLMWQVKRLAAAPTRAYVACAGRPDFGYGIVAGADGQVARVVGDAIEPASIPERPDVSAVALDVTGRAWAASLGSLWLQPQARADWERAWHEPSFNVPFVSVYADDGLVIALAADGGIVEGRRRGASAA